MPDLTSRLIAALNYQATLGVESTSALCSSVSNSTAYTKAPPSGAPVPKSPTPIPAASPVAIRPIELLKELGIAMMPPLHSAQRLASWHWTLVRYGYLIDRTPSQHLATNALVGDYKHHHMTALSEAFGVAAALAHARRWLERQVANAGTVFSPIDLDFLLTGSPMPGVGHAVSIGPAPGASRRPDYLIAGQRHDGAVRLLLVECKGTSGSRAQAIGQLGSAMHQLNGVEFGPSTSGLPVAVDRHAYATRVAKSGAAVEVLGVDPPEEGEQWVRPEYPDSRGDVWRRRESTHRLFLPPPEQVAGRSIDRLRDRVVAWSGLGDDGDEARSSRRTRIPTSLGELVGSTSEFSAPDGTRLQVFSGAAADVVDAALQPDGEEGAEAFRLAADRVRASRAPSGASEPLFSDTVDIEREASAVTDDGTVFSIRRM